MALPPGPVAEPMAWPEPPKETGFDWGSLSRSEAGRDRGGEPAKDEPGLPGVDLPTDGGVFGGLSNLGEQNHPDPHAPLLAAIDKLIGAIAGLFSGKASRKSPPIRDRAQHHEE